MSNNSSNTSSGNNNNLQQQTEEKKPIESVYPEVAAFYRANPSMIYFPKALDRTKRYWDVMTENNPVTKKIQAIYRIKTGGDNKEYVYFHQRLISTDYLGNATEFDWLNGKVEVPRARFEFIPEENKVLPVDVASYDTVYNIEFNEQNMKELLPQMDHNTKFYVDTGSVVYSITRDSFLEGEFEECIEYARTGHKGKGKVSK